MLTLLSEQYAPITKAIGYLKLPLDQAASNLLRWRRDLYPAVVESRPKEGFPAVLNSLEPLVFGSRSAELLVGAGSEWTALFDNGAQGGDPDSTLSVLVSRLGCQAVMIVTAPHTLGRGDVTRGRLGSVQFRLYGPTDRYDSYIRTIAAHFESRWEFDSGGTVQPFERPEAYGVRKIRDRFTTSMLAEYCRALGLDVFDPSFYGPDAVLIQWPATMPPTLPPPESLAQAQSRLGIVPRMADSLPG